MDNSEYRTGFATQEQSDSTTDSLLLSDLKKLVDNLTKQVEELTQFKNEISYGKGITNNDLRLDTGRRVVVGPAMFTNGVDSDEASSAIISTGRDRERTGGVENTQVSLLKVEDGLSFFYGLGGKLITGGDAKYSDGSNKLVSDSINSVETDSLVGQFVTVIFPDGSAGNYQISANSGNSITVSGTFPVTVTDGTFLIFDPINLGGWEYPWRRLYVYNGAGGGVQFGAGTPQNGQNGLLYMDGTSLIFRDPSGSTSVLGGGGGINWGSLTGTLSDQGDLQSELNQRLRSLAYSGSVSTGAGSVKMQSGSAKNNDGWYEFYLPGTTTLAYAPYWLSPS